MVFVGFGLIMGTAGFELLEVTLDSTGVELLAEATLGLLLFADTTRYCAAMAASTSASSRWAGPSTEMTTVSIVPVNGSPAAASSDTG
jgi:hypothetical protein